MVGEIKEMDYESESEEEEEEEVEEEEATTATSSNTRQVEWMRFVSFHLAARPELHKIYLACY